MSDDTARIYFYSRHVIHYTDSGVEAFSTRTKEERMRLWMMFAGPPADEMLDKFGVDGVVQWVLDGEDAVPSDGEDNVSGWAMGEGLMQGRGQPLAIITYTPKGTE